MSEQYFYLLHYVEEEEYLDESDNDLEDLVGDEDIH